MQTVHNFWFVEAMPSALLNLSQRGGWKVLMITHACAHNFSIAISMESYCKETQSDEAMEIAVYLQVKGKKQSKTCPHAPVPLIDRENGRHIGNVPNPVSLHDIKAFMQAVLYPIEQDYYS